MKTIFYLGDRQQMNKEKCIVCWKVIYIEGKHEARKLDTEIA